VRLHDTGDDRQAQARALLIAFRRKKRLEDALLVFS